MVLLCLHATGLLARSPPTQPTSPPRKAPVYSPKYAEFFTSLKHLAIQTPSQPPTITLTWDYPAAQLTNVVFEVYTSTNLVSGAALLTSAFQVPPDFTFFETVVAPPVVIPIISNAQFFIVRARLVTNSLVSEWNK